MNDAPVDWKHQAFAEAHRACIEQAEKLLQAAQMTVEQADLQNVAYHLAVLGLEEVGKASLLTAKIIVGNYKDSSWADKRLDDHVSKLTWAFWTPIPDIEQIDPKKFYEAQDLANRTHAKRLASLYVSTDLDKNAGQPPIERIDPGETHALIALAHAQLELEKSRQLSEDHKQNADLQWYLSAIEDEETQMILFSKEFMAQLENLEGDAAKWVKWARGEIARVEETNKKHLHMELARTPPKDTTEAVPKWEVTFRLYTTSHSIRPKVLRLWNEHAKWIELRSVGKKKDEIIVTLTLHDTITIQEVYGAGFAHAHIVAVALSVGSLGFFWFESPSQTTRYYEKIVDVTAPKSKLVVEQRPGKKIDWGQSALSELNIHRSLEFISVFTSISDEVGGRLFSPYIHGMVMLSKTDIHLSCEQHAYDAFLTSLRNGMKHFNDWSGEGADFEAALHNTFNGIIADEADRASLFEAILKSDENSEVSLDDVANAKRLTDLFYNLKASLIFRESARKAAKGH